ncbi:MAG: hypothetical protein JXA78_06425 [Anaerolineales bacterium]|nr:hypothetical protein [Anaerolineales bacterium]
MKSALYHVGLLIALGLRSSGSSTELREAMRVMNYRSFGYVLMLAGFLSVGLSIVGFAGLLGDPGNQAITLTLGATLVCFLMGEVMLRRANKVAWESCLSPAMICSNCSEIVTRSRWLEHGGCPECGCSDYV